MNNDEFDKAVKTAGILLIECMKHKGAPNFLEFHMLSGKEKYHIKINQVNLT